MVWQRLTDADFVSGATGKLAFRYEGNGGKLGFDAEMPQLEVGFAGVVPDGAVATLNYGYEAHSFTNAAGETEWGAARQRNAGGVNVAFSESPAQGSLRVEEAHAAEVQKGGGGWASHLLEVSVPEEGPSARGLALAARYMADEQGKGSVQPSSLRAFAVNEEDAKANPESAAYLGRPGEGGLIVLDVTGLTDEQRASIDPASATSIEALGLECLPYQVSDEGRVVVQMDDAVILAGKNRVFYLAAPYRHADLSFDADDAEAGRSLPVRIVFEAQPILHVGSSAEVFVLREAASIAFAESENPPEPSAPQPGNTEENGSGENETPGQFSGENAGEDATEGPAVSDATSAPTYANPLIGPMRQVPGGIALYSSLITDSDLLDLFEVNLDAYSTTEGQPLRELAGAMNTYMVGLTDSVVVNATFQSKDFNVSFGSKDQPASFTIEIPYFYRDKFGCIRETPSWNVYVGEVAKNQSVNPEYNATTGVGSPMRMILSPTGLEVLFQSYRIYDLDTNEYVTTKTEIGGVEYDGSYQLDPRFQGKGLTGSFRFEIANLASEDMAGVLTGDNYCPIFSVLFSDNVPENTGGNVLMGGEAYCYREEGGNLESCNVQVSPGEKSDTSTRTIAFIKSNLNWDVTVTPLSEEQLLWDRFNYHVYKVEVVNDSPGKDTPIDILSYNFKFPHDGSSFGGVTLKDLATFDENGNPVADPEGEFEHGTFTGKPGQGGALVYDVTSLDQTFWDNIDLETFSNVGDWGLSSIPYKTQGRKGEINFYVQSNETDEYGLQKPILLPEGNDVLDENGDPYRSKVTLLVAIPYTTNIVFSTYGSGESQRKQYSPLSFNCIPTVYFGNRGLEGFTWSKAASGSQTFRDVYNSMDMHKIAANYDPDTGERAWEESGALTQDRMGYPSSYRLQGFSAKGNIHIAGTGGGDGVALDSPCIVDDLPDNWNLSTVTLRVKQGQKNRQLLNVDRFNGVLPDSGLENWFDTTTPVVEFQVCSAPRETQWIEPDQLSWVSFGANGSSIEYGGTEDGYDVYRVGSLDGCADGNDIATRLEDMGICAKAKSRLVQLPGNCRWFTGKVRVRLAPELPVSEVQEGQTREDAAKVDVALPFDVTFTGIMRSPSSNGTNGYYTNQATLSSGVPTWYAPANSADYDRGWYSGALRTKTAAASIEALSPVTPKVGAYGFVRSEVTGNPVWGSDGGMRLVPVNEERSGIAFVLANPHVSKMEPGSFTTSTFSEGNLIDLDEPNNNLLNGGLGNSFYSECLCKNGDISKSHQGFIPSLVFISKGLLDHADVTSVTIHRMHENDGSHAPGPLTLTREQLNDYVVTAGSAYGNANPGIIGSVVIPQSEWGFDGRPDARLDSVTVEFDSFDGNVAQDRDSALDGAIVAIYGNPGVVGKYPASGTLATKYDAGNENQSATNTAVIYAAAPFPEVHGYGYRLEQGYAYMQPEGQAQRVPMSKKDSKSGFAFYVDNPTPSEVENGSIDTTAFTFAYDEVKGFSGFNTNEVYFSKLLRDTMDIAEVTFHSKYYDSASNSVQDRLLHVSVQPAGRIVRGKRKLVSICS